MGMVRGEAHWESVSGGLAACDSMLVCVSGPLQPVRPDTGAPTVSTRVTVTTVPSAAPTTASAGAARAGLDSTARSVSLSPASASLLGGQTVTSAGGPGELQQKSNGNLFVLYNH